MGEVQLCRVKPPPVCHKFFNLTAEVTAPVLHVGMAKNYHGEKKKSQILCSVTWELILPGDKDYKQERGFCGMKQNKEGIWSPKWKEGRRWVYYTHT